MPTSASAAAIVAGSIGSCRGSTLWSILRRSRNPAWTRRHRSSSMAGGRRPGASGARTSRASTADSTSGAGSNASRGTRRTMRRDGVVLDEDREVAHRAGRRGDPLRHLALDHEDAALRARPRLAAEQPVEHRARHVVGEVGHDVVRRGREGGEVLVEHVALDEREGARGQLQGERTAQVGDHAAVDLDGGDPGPGGQQAAGEDAEPRADLEHAAVRASGPPPRGSPPARRRRPGSSG